ncbi:MAG: DUF1667 domain-containing protein [Oscillospiraceae bacterium]
MTKNFVCIVCPNSCRLSVCDDGEEITVSGNNCKRGITHGINEFKNPMRMITSTVAILDGTLPRLSVISTGEVPKTKLKECLDTIYSTTVKAPIKCGDVIITNINGTEVDIIASRTMKIKER